MADDEIALPALLRAARGAYAGAIRSELAAVGLDDLPRNGAFVIGGMANRGGTAGDLISVLGVSKQAASQLIGALVVRGYLDRAVDPSDRRRVTLELTERGRAAGNAIRTAVRDVDEQLSSRLAPGELAGLRAGLLALADIKQGL